MKKQLSLDKDALFEACKKVAAQTLWQDPKPSVLSDIIDSDQIKRTIQGYFENALFYEEFLIEQKKDPNLITCAVLYLSEAHAVPLFKEDLTWFKNMLEVLIELVCPNLIYSEEIPQFLYDIEEGIKETRKNINDI